MAFSKLLGFLLAYSIFTAVLFYLTKYELVYVIAATLFIVLSGILLKRWFGSSFDEKGFIGGFKEFGSLVTTVVNSLLLSVVYFTAVGITSVVALLMGKHFLDTGKKVRWETLNLKKKSLEEYYRQF